ncbi:MAG: tetratricopeptide repeat protein [Deltaproteobacteria bacterium]|nr:tetratricopeptide repeat protein [Deltaproteobacteria bacterium]
MGVEELRTGRIRESLRHFMESVKLHPDFAEAQNGLGLAHMFLGNEDLAVAHFERALEIKKDYSEVRNNMARVLLNQGRYREAIPLLEKALEDVFLPNRYLAECNLGWAYFNVGREKEGMERVMSALAQNEKYCVGYEYLGQMFQRRKQYDQAIEEYKNVMVHCPEYPPGRLNLGRVMLLKGDVEAGCAQLDLCRKKDRMRESARECERLFRTSCSEASAPP